MLASNLSKNTWQFNIERNPGGNGINFGFTDKTWEHHGSRETEREILPEEDDKAVSGHMDIARLFEQKSLLICQSFVLEATEFVLIFSMIMLPK